MRRTLLPLAAVLCMGCMAAGGYLLARSVPFSGLADLLQKHAGGWPATVRALLLAGAALAVATGALRVERASWRVGTSGALAWIGFGVMVGVWAAVMPRAVPGWEWSAAGLGAGAALAAFAQWFAGWAGGRQALRDVVLCGVFGYAVAWSVAPFVQGSM